MFVKITAAVIFKDSFICYKVATDVLISLAIHGSFSVKHRRIVDTMYLMKCKIMLLCFIRFFLLGNGN